MSALPAYKTTPFAAQRKQLIIAICIAFVIHLLLASTFTIQPADPRPPLKSLTLDVKLGTGSKSPAPSANILLAKEYQPAVDRDQTTEVNAPVKKKAKPNNIASKKPAPRKVRNQLQPKAIKKISNKQDQPLAVVSGDVLGNKQQAQQLVAKRYRQQLSLWIDKYKIYPASVRQARITGEVVVKVVIDQQGNIINSTLKQPSPYPILNQLALDAVRRANPVPAVPEAYPNKNKHLGFNIGLTFKLK